MQGVFEKKLKIFSKKFFGFFFSFLDVFWILFIEKSGGL